MSIHSVDFDYQKIFDIKMAQGRYFSRDHPTDISDGIIVNETAAKIMGMESPIGQRISCWIPYDPMRSGTIIGVVKDFHFRSLHEKINPLVLVIAPGWFTDAYIRIKPENIPETLVFLEKTIKESAPDFPLEYSFLDEDIDNLYKSEQRIGNLVRYGTFLAIFIACLGLFGLASFTAEKRRKEIGIRKVLGASVSGIVLLLTKEFTKWVIFANLIAWPIAYYVMSRWLQNFAYHVKIGIWTFLLSAALALVTALITISFQAAKTAASNPVDSLRYE
jgi:putative ABC transport system permease protein